MRFVFARERFIKTDPTTGSHRVFHFGQRVPDDDPCVKESPADFMSGDEWLRSGGHGVEDASARPGERRNR